jgi:Rieske Fe-S protein
MERRTLLAASGAVVALGAVSACASDSSTSEVEAESSEPTGEFAPGSLSTADVAVGGGVVLDEQAVVVVQPEAGTYLAYTAVCPHQGCLVSTVVDNEIICPCHDSVFSAVDGAVVRGPALQGLASAAITVDGDIISAG